MFIGVQTAFLLIPDLKNVNKGMTIRRLVGPNRSSPVNEALGKMRKEGCPEVRPLWATR